MHSLFKRLFIALTLVIGVVTVGAPIARTSAATPDNSPTYSVNLTRNGFSPNNLIIARNSTVVFTNTDTLNHAVTSTNAAGAGPNSSNISPGQSYTFVFQSLGPFDLVDTLNRNATAKITVYVPGTPGINAPNGTTATTKGNVPPPPAPAPAPAPPPVPSAAGPVATGSGTDMLTYVSPILFGTLCFLAAGILIVARYRKQHLPN